MLTQLPTSNIPAGVDGWVAGSTGNNANIFAQLWAELGNISKNKFFNQMPESWKNNPVLKINLFGKYEKHFVKEVF